jgi:hypothetical protein
MAVHGDDRTFGGTQMRELGLVVRWGRFHPGMGERTVELIADALKYFYDRTADGTLSYFEPFICQTGDHDENLGFFLMKGPEANILRVLEDEERIRLDARAAELVTHLRTEVLAVGADVLTYVQRMVEADATATVA